MTKIICTGTPEHGGICKSLHRVFPETFFVSRRNGFDLSTKQGLEMFYNIVDDFDVFINHSQIDLGVQETLLRNVAKKWHKGTIINIGSIIEFEEWRWVDTVTSEEKISLREQSIYLASENLKTTHLITSGFQRHGPEEDIKIHPDKIVSVIQWILASNLHIPLIYVDELNDARLEKWRYAKQQGGGI